MRRALWLSLMCLSAGLLPAQTTQGIVTGRVFDRQSNAGIAGATVTYTNLDTNETGSVHSGAKGTYALTFLPPGRYRMKAEAAPDYQPQTLQSMDLQVAGRVELNFPLRSYAELKRQGIYNGAGGVSLAGQREVVNFFGPDVGFAAPLQVLEPESGTLQPSLSYVFESDVINGVPLNGRDAYSLLLTVPGASSDTATALSLSLAINGQRPFSSNFLLDGVENNDTLNTGPRIQVAQELVESYRASTNNFSAEFGGTSGFVANVVTKAGTNAFHGTVYGYLGNNVLNANSFQDNLQGFSRRPDRELYAGFWAGGPVRKNRLWFSSGFEHYDKRGNNEPLNYDLPTSSVLTLFNVPTSRLAAQLLQRFPSPAGTSQDPTAVLTLAPPVAVNQILLLERMDYRSASGADRFTGRVALERQALPDFSFSPYQAFTSGAGVNSSGVTGEYQHTLNAALVNDFRFGWNNEDQYLSRAHPEIPTLEGGPDPVLGLNLTLPGSPLRAATRDRASTLEVQNSVVWIRGRQIVTAGGGYEMNRPSFWNSYGQSGDFIFNGVFSFVLDQPIEVGFPASRQAPDQLAPPDLNRSYRNNQFFGFVQDDLKLTSRLGLSLGVRYDSFGTMKNTGIQDAVFREGTGASIEEKIANGGISYNNPGQNSIYAPARNDWSGRLGLSWDLMGNGTTILRGGFGIYYDRPYGLLLQGIQLNDVNFRNADLPNNNGPVNYLAPFPQVLGGLVGPVQSFSSGSPDFYWIDPKLRTPHVQTWFAGVQRQIRRNLTFEVSNTGALGRKLVDTDGVNRLFSVPQGPSNGLLNPNAPPDIVYRSNSGSSDYLALSGIARYRTAHAAVQVSYTYSHSIDNQSDPLLGQPQVVQLESATSRLGSTENFGVAAFTSQFDSRIDRASSDFDQRQNLVFYSLFDLPGPGRIGLLRHLLSGWQTSQLGAFRSGFPFTVFAPSGVNSLINNRADYLGGSTEVSATSLVPGGRQFLNPAAFGNPAQGTLFSTAIGTLGRNSITGPGFYSVDASISRSFGAARLGDATRLSIRADFFNVLNHTNLGNPDNLLSSPTFGASQFGTTGRPTSSLLGTAAIETPREVRVQLKVVF